MKIRIVSVGKTKQAFVKEGEAEYLKRLPREFKIELIELGADKFAALPREQALEKEAEALLARLTKDEFLVVLDERGTQQSSQAFAAWFAERMQRVAQITFAVGGADGWHESVKQRAELLLSLSRFTLPHQLARLVLIEQLYRASTIIKGGPYHK